MFIIFHILDFVLYPLSFSEEELSIDGKKQEMKKEEYNNTGPTNVEGEREREEKWPSDIFKANIPWDTHIQTDVQVFRVGEFTCNALTTQW